MRLPLGAALAAVLIAAGACSSGSEPPAEDRARKPAEPAPSNAIAATPSAPPALPRPSAFSAASPEKGVRRCGWLSNPTPANWWLTDSQGQWILGSQGADQAPGMDELPDMTTAGWVETNGHYGYGCACMTIASDAEGRVTRVADASPRPLEQCRADRKLPKPE